jgi:hypothetical protein
VFPDQVNGTIRGGNQQERHKTLQTDLTYWNVKLAKKLVMTTKKLRQ